MDHTVDLRHLEIAVSLVATTGRVHNFRTVEY